ncbi:MAG: TonB-dependent receptor [Marinilabiliales bacterium]
MILFCKYIKIKYFLLLSAFFIFSQNFAQKYTISGYISDGETGEKLINANVYDANTMLGTVTNNYGFFSLTLPKGHVIFTVSYMGFQTYTKEIDLSSDITLSIELEPSILLNQVEIVETKTQEKLQSTQMSAVEIPIKDIKKLPVLFGEVDVLKTIQLMPGIQSGNEGTSGLYVRGGGPDQNLILLDGVSVYNADHLFGFFSVFNADAISSVRMIKGGFPARYGGRLSSVLDIRMKEGNKKELKGNASVGLISSKLSIEGPLKKDKSSFIISGRRTYIDILAQPLIRSFSKNKNEQITAGYYFYDLNAKINYEFSEKNKLYLSAYMGNDKAYSRIEYNDNNSYPSYEEKFKSGLGWGNITTALRWNYQFNKHLFSNTTITYSRYRFYINQDMDETTTDSSGRHNEQLYFEYFSGIEDVVAAIDFDYIPGVNHYFRFGVRNIYHTFKPGITVARYNTNLNTNNIDTTFGNQNIYANEYQAYIEDDIRIGANFKTNIGLHYSGFFVRDVFYNHLQPRVSARYIFNEDLTIKASFSQMNQYIHLLTNSGIGLPTDLWLPVTDSVKPMNSYQVAAGGVYALNKNMDVSIEGFYKTMDNLIEYKEGASFFNSTASWETKIEMGHGWSYGIEVLLQKHVGKTTGWIGYTLSWAKRQFDNISFGEVFPYKYDRRHDVSVAITHKIDDNIDIGVTWVYGTGNAVTLGLEKYLSMSDVINGMLFYPELIENIEHRNNYRMPSYNRLDACIHLHKKWEWRNAVRTWTIGVYNLYNRKNPFYLYFGYDDNNNRVLKQISLFPLIPSVSYNLSF